MDTIRIRLTEDQRDKLNTIAESTGRSITKVIRDWIDAYGQTYNINDLFRERKE